MNIYGSVFLNIANYERNLDIKKAIVNFKKSIKFNTENLQLNQDEIDCLLSEYKNKSIEINKALLAANDYLLKENKDQTFVRLLLTEKYFKLDGLSDLFIMSGTPPPPIIAMN